MSCSSFFMTTEIPASRNSLIPSRLRWMAPSVHLILFTDTAQSEAYVTPQRQNLSFVAAGCDVSEKKKGRIRKSESE